MSRPVPVAIFAYNRPVHLAALLASYSACSGRERTRPVIFCDGPKTPEQSGNVEAVIEVAEAWADAHGGEVRRAPGNQGLSRSIRGGVASLLEESDRVIVLEDDLRLHPRFLEFHLEGLERYAAAGQVYQISGFQWRRLPFPASALFAPLTTTWGWSTWRRAWNQFDEGTQSIERLERDPALRRRFDLEGRYPYTQILRDRLAGRNDSWGILWYWTVCAAGGLVLYPPYPLLSNEGFDGSGTHCGVDLASEKRVHFATADRRIRLPRSIRSSRWRYRLMKQALQRKCQAEQT